MEQEEKQTESQNMDKDFLAKVTEKIKEGKRYYEEVTIAKVTEECPYGHKEGDTYKATNINSGGLCGSLYRAIQDSVLTIHYGASVPWEKGPNTFKGFCPEMGRVQVEVKRLEKDDYKILKTRPSARDMTGKGFSALDKYRMFVEILDIGRECTWGHRAGQKFEVDPFNVGEACAMLYGQAYHTMNILFSEQNLPWEGEEHIAHLVCPDTYNQTVFRLVRETR
jgi:uncharacterized repeat protein (TIGR04076 family)